MPQLKPYNGTTNPLDYLESYRALDALLHIAYLTTSWKAAQVWYSRLEPKSINSFEQLEKQLHTSTVAVDCHKIPIASSPSTSKKRSH